MKVGADHAKLLASLRKIPIGHLRRRQKDFHPGKNPPLKGTEDGGKGEYLGYSARLTLHIY